MPWDHLKDFETEEKVIKVKQGNVKVIQVGAQDSDRPVAVLLSHSYTSMVHQIPAYLYCGYQIVYMCSTEPIEGIKFSQRSEDILKPGGQADIIN